MSTDYDSPWREALDAYFEPFLELLFPSVYRQIDWSHGDESLDKEFQQLVREAKAGRRYVESTSRAGRQEVPHARKKIRRPLAEAPEHQTYLRVPSIPSVAWQP